MPQNDNDIYLSGQPYMPVTSTALWSWNVTGGPSETPVAVGFPPGGLSQPTKTGLTTGAVGSPAGGGIVGVPLMYYGNPPTPVPSGVVLEWLRQAEDQIEQETGILLCQTWVAAPQAKAPGSPQAIGLVVQGSSGQQQQLGYDFDLGEAAYDFFFPRALDEGWLYQSLRWKPVRSITYDLTDYTAIKRYANIYPLLNTWFVVPPNWNVEDEDAGLVRLVPAVNVQMLPLFAVQLTVEGFADSVPGGLWLQYTAGLTPNDYNTRFKFMRRLVLLEAGLMALRSIQGTINMGAEEVSMTVDGMQYRMRYPKDGPFGPIIRAFESERDKLYATARNKVSRPTLIAL